MQQTLNFQFWDACRRYIDDGSCGDVVAIWFRVKQRYCDLTGENDLHLTTDGGKPL
jgi:hypothetical protein